MPGKRPMTPSVQSPTLAKDLGKGSGNQSLVNNPNAAKAAPPKATPTPTAAPKPAATPTPTAAPKPAATPTTPAAKPAEPKKRETQLFHTDLFDLVKGHLLDEGYAETEEGAIVMMVNMSEGWRESILESCGVELELLELTGGKGHPGYKAGSGDRGPMQSGHSADSEKRKDKGGTMSQRHGYHLDDIDDNDDDDGDEYESIVKQQSRDSRERVRKPLRDKVKSARKVLSKEDYVNESQHARENPEKYERSSEAREGRRRRSGINDPNTGINSPAFKAFMAQQMGGKKKKD